MTSDKREKAIKYLTEEIRSLRMAPQINGCPMTPEWAEQISVLEACLEAVRAYHISEATDMIPLTLEQLRKMDGRPVWCKSLINGKSEWAIIRIVEMSKTWFIALAGASQGFGDKDTYGKTWLAYAYPTANIEREAWVSVDDRLPPDMGDVLVVAFWHERWQAMIGWHSDSPKRPWRVYMSHGEVVPGGVTYWMPLPEPPESRPLEEDESQ